LNNPDLDSDDYKPRMKRVYSNLDNIKPNKTNNNNTKPNQINNDYYDDETTE